MKHIVFIVLIGLLFMSKVTIAQGYPVVWYFGENAGIDFNQTPPDALTNSAMNTQEGCCVVTDTSGDVMFYASGDKIFNKNHQIMLNGDEMDGCYSATQSVTIVPKPFSDRLFYLFTVDCIENSLANGLRYSIVDMSMDGSLGAVTDEKNIFLYGKATEKLVAVKAANDNDFWIISHKWESNAFYVYKLTSTGLDDTPIISLVGLVHDDIIRNAIGQMKVSPQRDKIALVIESLQKVEIFSFNDTTGIVSDPETMDFPGYGRGYGLEFSPDGKMLYVDSWDIGGGLYQFDLSRKQSNKNKYSSVLIYSASGNSQIGELMLGPDNKIYLARRHKNFVGVINKPNLPGTACDFVKDGISLDNKNCRFGLPSYIIAYNSTFDFTFNPLCYGDTTMFYSRISQSDSVQWNFDDPASGIENHSTVLNPGHVFTSTGTFDVVLTVWIGGTSKTLTKQVTITETVPVSLGPDTTFCNGNTLLLSPGSNYSHYLWQDGSTDSLFVASDAGTYWVQVTDSSGCKATDSITIDTFPGFDFSIGNDTTICFGDYVFLYAPPGFESYQWQDGSGNTSYIADTSGYYWLQVTDTNNCVARDSMLLTANKVPDNILGNDTLFCKDGTLTLRTNPVYEQYFWNNGSNDSVLTTSQPGKYWVTVFDTLGCSGSDTIQLDYFPAIILELNATGQLCEDDSVILQAVSNYNNYLWQDSSQNQTYIARDSGIYWVKVTTPCETKSDSITIDACSSIWIPNVFTPNNDGYNDYFGAVAKNIIKFKLVIFNRWGQELKTLHNIDEKWDGTYRGQKAAQGTYFWVADYEQVERDGSTKHVRLQGSVTLIR